MEADEVNTTESTPAAEPVTEATTVTETTTATAPVTETTTLVEPRGEVQIDSSARANVVGGGEASAEHDNEVIDQNVSDAQRDALRNAEGEQTLQS